MPPKQKRPRQSPKKNVDKCLTCSANLDENSSALNCDDCENWVCAACLKLTDSEYDLLSKMVEKISLKWVCPACKVSPQNTSHQGASATEITSIVGNTLTTLQLSINQSIAQSAESLRTELTTIREKVNVVESSLASKCSADDARRIARGEVCSLQFNFKQSLESDVRRIVRAEKDRENRKIMLSLMVYKPPRMTAELFFRS